MLIANLASLDTPRKYILDESGATSPKVQTRFSLTYLNNRVCANFVPGLASIDEQPEEARSGLTDYPAPKELLLGHGAGMKLKRLTRQA